MSICCYQRSSGATVERPNKPLQQAGQATDGLSEFWGIHALKRGAAFCRERGEAERRRRAAKGDAPFRVTGGGVAEQMLHPTGAAILVSRGSLALGAAPAGERGVRPQRLPDGLRKGV